MSPPQPRWRNVTSGTASVRAVSIAPLRRSSSQKLPPTSATRSPGRSSGSDFPASSPPAKPQASTASGRSVADMGRPGGAGCGDGASYG